MCNIKAKNSSDTDKHINVPQAVLSSEAFKVVLECSEAVLGGIYIMCLLL